MQPGELTPTRINFYTELDYGNALAINCLTNRISMENFNEKVLSPQDDLYIIAWET